MWSIDKLDSSNWTTWKFQIKHLLLARGLWGLVKGTEQLQDFERDMLVNRLLLKKQYLCTDMKEGSSVEQHIKTMKKLTDRLAAINVPISEEDQIVTLLGSLLSSYSTLVTALEARDAITFSYAQQALIQEEQRLKGESKAGGSAATGGSTGRALLGKQTEKGRKNH